MPYNALSVLHHTTGNTTDKSKDIRDVKKDAA